MDVFIDFVLEVFVIPDEHEDVSDLFLDFLLSSIHLQTVFLLH